MEGVSLTQTGLFELGREEKTELGRVVGKVVSLSLKESLPELDKLVV